MGDADTSEQVDSDDIILTEAMSGYSILVDGEHAGGIEGRPGHFEYIELELHWEGMGVARGALNEFIALSRVHGCSAVTTTNATNPAMEHILETEGFERQSDDIGWVREI